MAVEAHELIPTWSVGDRLRKSREHAGISREEMATRMDVTPGAISHWENDRQRPRNLLDVINKWAAETGVPAQWLLGLESKRMYKSTRHLHPIPDSPEVSTFA